MSLKIGDKVVVIAGKDKKKEGKIIGKKGDKVLVEGVNVVKKCVKPNGQDQNGGIIDKEAFIHVSNVKVIDSKKKEAVKTKETKKETKTKKVSSKSKKD